MPLLATFPRKLAKGRVPLLVALVTRAHAHLLDDGHPFCSHLIAKVPKPTEPQHVDLLTAVVDGIPTMLADSSAKGGRLSSNETSEGISIMLSDSEAVTPDLWSAQRWPEERQSPTMRQDCVLSFQFARAAAIVAGTALPYDTTHPISRRLQLPVANTIFQNGYTSTLVAQRWNSADASTGGPEMLQIKRSRLPDQILLMNDFVTSSGMINTCTLDMPLTAITLPRKVGDSVGNIIRTLEIVDGLNKDKPVPASIELEESVSRWMEMQTHTKERVDIWALVTPYMHKTTNPGMENLSLQLALESGSHLHKVLSGGGGWGAKQGLLSLDPDIKYGKSQQEGGDFFDDDSNFEAQQKQAFGEIVKPGDIVTFFVLDRSRSSKTQADDVRVSGLRKTSDMWPSIVLTTIPSTADTMPVPITKNTDTPNIQPIFAWNCFGMASEGMALTIDRSEGANSEETSYSVQTKIDVPHTHYLHGKRTL